MSSSPQLPENWRPVASAEGFYSVSSLGRVRSEPLPCRTSGRQRGRVLALSLDTKGYPIVGIFVPEGRRSRTQKVHRLVAEAFLGPANGQQVNHINGDKTDNRVENLEYVSCRDNVRHCWRHGLHGTDHCRGSANTNAKLTDEDVRSIRSLHPGISSNRLAEMFGVSATNIGQIVKRKTWRHV